MEVGLVYEQHNQKQKSMEVGLVYEKCNQKRKSMEVCLVYEQQKQKVNRKNRNEKVWKSALYMNSKNIK